MHAQCYRCQQFYHHSWFCNGTPKCLKCVGSHITRDCTKTMQNPDKCALCRSPYPANFSRCAKNPLNIKLQNPYQQTFEKKGSSNYKPKMLLDLKLYHNNL
ncbi:RNA-directed DNA polymerase from mobile element jockey [Nephila pilipes]|uniref:RNA-directed DNA polymerase from mobile element jockey n=1 Tax=Nephila pilipes TaxID=299642 RepID=A0A8X6TQK2_NEPPI|nr:RNA-directed DNA polymerase from mobile element jockey [Nephila pilipes]